MVQEVGQEPRGQTFVSVTERRSLGCWAYVVDSGPVVVVAAAVVVVVEASCVSVVVVVVITAVVVGSSSAAYLNPAFHTVMAPMKLLKY